MYPNTFMMQELIRRYYDDALDREDTGQEVDTPYIYSVPNGESVAYLTLMRRTDLEYAPRNTYP
jgi:hypothetical protein